MRLKKLQVTDPEELRRIMEKASVCHLGMCRSGRPYVVPMCYGYRGDRIYFHCASEGQKLEIMDQNPHVCFQMECDVSVVESSKACGWSMDYNSVTGFGRLRRARSAEEKRIGLQAIMKHYSGRDNWKLKDQQVESTTVLVLEVEEMTGKDSRKDDLET
ncbi:MAG: pyridoxamine 5'-phosphate oxidase family protein [Candidatus Aegiribacteria sp.]|nr:pyridoxamine 5'-phosphate oxidase family protein [Candidatus Aegiribacteria sp.]